MPVSHLQKAGIIAGSIPLVGTIAGIVKFFIYWNKEAQLEPSLRARLEEKASDVKGAAKDTLTQTSIAPSDLKWYALLQVIPFVGIYGALEEEKFLEQLDSLKLKSHRVNQVAQVFLGKVKEEKGSVSGNSRVGQGKKEKKLALTPETYRAYAAQMIENTPSEKISVHVKHVNYRLEQKEGLASWVQTDSDQEVVVDRKEFVRSVLKEKDNNKDGLRFANAVLLINTLCKPDFPFPTTLRYSNFGSSKQLLDALRNQPITKAPIVYSMTKDFFDYTAEGDFYIDFANAQVFGGAYDTFGCVQEERMFVELMALAWLDYITEKQVHCTEDPKKYPPNVAPAPFVVEGITRDFDISKTPYGSRVHQVKEASQLIDAIEAKENPVPVNILGLAALDFREEELKYTLKGLEYSFDACVLANLGAKEISPGGEGKEAVHTADWGCGAFLNSVKMMVAIQYLAARMTGTPLVWHGVGNVKPEYTEELVNTVSDEINQWIEEGKTPQQIIEVLLDRSQNDDSWRPS